VRAERCATAVTVLLLSSFGIHGCATSSIGQTDRNQTTIGDAGDAGDVGGPDAGEDAQDAAPDHACPVPSGYGSSLICCATNTIASGTGTLASHADGSVTTTARTVSGDAISVDFTGISGGHGTAAVTWSGSTTTFAAVTVPTDGPSAEIITGALAQGLAVRSTAAINGQGAGSGNPGNHAGCDVFACTSATDLSCTNEGACCDQHDRCINENSCTGLCGTPAAQDMPLCSSLYSWLRNPGVTCCPNAQCAFCQGQVEDCMTGEQAGGPSGPSGCCNDWGRGGNVCGTIQQCTYTNGAGQYVVETDPCVCAEMGLSPQNPPSGWSSAACDGDAGDYSSNSGTWTGN